MLHRLAILYVTLPLAIWLVDWFEWWVSVPLMALLALGLRPALSGSWRAGPPTLATLVLLLAALGWVMLTGAGNFLDHDNYDWPTNRAIFLDLARGARAGGPTVYPMPYLEAEPFLLRYYLGWYMVPGLAGRWLGPATLNWAVPLWTWAGTVLVALLFARGLPTWRAALLAAVILVFFSGMDALKVLAYEGLPGGIEFFEERFGNRGIYWRPDVWGPTRLDHPGNMMTFRFKPLHIIVAGLALLLMMQLRRQARFLAVVGIVLAACVFWSALVSISLLVLACGLLVCNPLRPFLTWQNLLVAPLFAAVLALYLTSGKTDFYSAWLWQVYDDRWLMARDVVILYLTEFLVLAVLLWRTEPAIFRDPFFLIAVGLLLLAPWLIYGRLDFSELSRHLLMPPVMALAYFAARSVVHFLLELRRPTMLGDRVWTWMETPARRGSPAALTGLIAVLGIGAVSSVYEVAQAFSNVGMLRYERAQITLLDRPLNSITQRVSTDVPDLLQLLLRTPDIERTGAETGELVVETGTFDVYLEDARLVYVHRRCHILDDSRETRDTAAHIFLHLYAADVNDLPEKRRRYGFDNLDFTFEDLRLPVAGRNACIAVRNLPGYPIIEMKTGQHLPDAGRLWEASIPIAAPETPK